MTKYYITAAMLRAAAWAVIKWPHNKRAIQWECETTG